MSDKKKIMWLFLMTFVAVFFVYCMGVFFIKETSAEPESKYVKVDNKKINYEDFVNFLDDPLNSNISLDCENVKNIIFIGEGQPLNEKIFLRFPNMRKLTLGNFILSKSSFSLCSSKTCGELNQLSIVNSKLDSIDSILIFKNIESLNLLGTETENYDLLEEFEGLNEIYLDKDVDRQFVAFMRDSFKNGDMYTRAFYSKKAHNLKGA